MPIIIYGTRGLMSQVSSGDFVCPHCLSASSYELKQVRRFFTLFFIPIFPVSGATRFVECGHCGSLFEEAVLEHQPSPGPAAPGAPEYAATWSSGPPEGEERLLAWVHEQLLDGTSLGKAQAKLTEAGYDPGRAESVIREMCGGEPKRCGCGRQYHPQVLQCGECGDSL